MLFGIKSPLILSLVMSFFMVSCGVNRPTQEDPSAQKSSSSKENKEMGSEKDGEKSENKETSSASSGTPEGSKEDLAVILENQKKDLEKGLNPLKGVLVGKDSDATSEQGSKTVENVVPMETPKESGVPPVATEAVADESVLSEPAEAAKEEITAAGEEASPVAQDVQDSKKEECSAVMSDTLPEGSKKLNILELLAFFQANSASKMIYLTQMTVQAENIAITDGVTESKVVLDIVKEKNAHLKSQLLCREMSEGLMQVTVTSASSLDLATKSYGSTDIIAATIQPQSQTLETSEATLTTPVTINSPDSLMNFIGVSAEDIKNGFEVKHEVLQLNEKQIQIRVQIKEPAVEGSLVQQTRKIHYTYSL